MIPQDRYDRVRGQNLLWYLIDELWRTMGDRGNLEEHWVRWEKIYRARPNFNRKDFPFVGASNLVVPIVATDVDTLFARAMGLLLEPSNLWSVTAERPELIDYATKVQDFLEWAQHNEIRPNRALGNWVLELHKLGTSVLKTRYVREMQKVFEWRELGNRTVQQQATILMQDHPAIDHVRLWDAYIPAGFATIKDAPWFAERIRLTWPRFMNRVKAGIYTNADQIGAWFFNPPLNRVQSRADSISGYRASINTQMEFYEFWLDYDIDGDGWDEALVCTIHYDSQTYVRLDFNPFFNQEKPYTASTLMPDVNSFYGIGLCEMLDQYQEEITAMHNQRIDNGTVVNSQTYAIKSSNKNIRKDEKTYPGKIWLLNDPKADIYPVPLGAGMGSALSAQVESEQVTRQEAQRRTGVNDYVQGNAGPAQAYGAAYTTQQMIMQADKRFGETFRSIRDGIGEAGMLVLELYQQYNQGGKPFVAMGQRDGQMVNAILQFPMDLIRKGLKVSVTAIDTSSSKDARIRTTTLVMQMLAQFYQQYFQFLMMAMNPQMPPPMKQVAISAAEGSATLMRRLLELYGQRDYDRLIPELQGAAANQQLQLANLQAVLQSGAAGGTQGPPSPTGLQGVPAGSYQLPGPGNYVNSANQLGPGGGVPGAGGIPGLYAGPQYSAQPSF